MILPKLLVLHFESLILLFQMSYFFMQFFLLLCLAFAEGSLSETVLKLSFLCQHVSTSDGKDKLTASHNLRLTTLDEEDVDFLLESEVWDSGAIS